LLWHKVFGHPGNHSHSIMGLCFLLYVVVVYTLHVPYLYRLYIFYHLSDFFVPILCPRFSIDW